VPPFRRLAVPTLGAVAGLAVAAPQAGAAIEVSTKPSLRPAFDRGVSDYVARCRERHPLRVFVHASGGDRVVVAGGTRRGGTFEQDVSRASDHAFAIRVRSAGRTQAYHVRCLPLDFPSWRFKATGRAQAQWYVLAPTGAAAHGYAAIFDTDGVPVWWWHSSSYGPWDAKLLPDGTLAWARYFGDHFGMRGRANAYDVLRLDGTPVREVRTAGSPTDTHDLQELPNGHYLAITYRPRTHVDLSGDPRGGPADATVYDGVIQELTPRGKVVWHWSSKDHIPASWTTGNRTSGWWVSQPPGDTDGLIVSARHLDSILRIDRRTGGVDWKLGGRFVAGKSLTVLGAPPGFLGERLFGGQHDARLWKDGSLTVHDNGSWQSRPPVVDRFEVDAAARTARLVERVTNPEVGSSTAIGGARKLSGGNWVVAWGNSPLATEQTETGAVVRRFDFGDRFSYRVVPIEPGRIGAGALRRGMDRLARRGGGA
jgi:hypothetical protein